MSEKQKTKRWKWARFSKQEKKELKVSVSSSQLSGQAVKSVSVATINGWKSESRVSNLKRKA